MSEGKKSGWMTGHAFQVAAAYVLWLVSAALSFVALLWVRIFVLIDLPMVVFRLDPWVLRAINRFGTFILGLVWLLYLIASEAYFRRLYEEQMPVVNVLKVFVVEAAILGAAYGGDLLIG
jgi:hypothetical protein